MTLSKPVMADLTAYKEHTGMSHPNILFDAIEFSHDELPHLIKDRATRLNTDRKRLFSRPASPARHDDAETETFIVRMTGSNKRVIDDLVKHLEAPNRTVMLAAAYEHYLAAMTDHQSHKEASP